MQENPYSRGNFNVIQDKKLVYDWDDICFNEKEFKEIIDKHQADKNKIVVWVCSFCSTKNVIYCHDLKFAKNNSRVVEKPARK